MPQSLPCPHCGRPVGPAFRNVAQPGAAIAGLCPACLQPYRFGARVRRVAFVSMLAFATFAAALAYAFARCAACVAPQPAMAWVPTLGAVAWLAGTVAAGALGARLYVARARDSAARPLVVAVDPAEVGTSVDNLRVRPRTAIAAAVALSSRLLFMLADEWRAIAARLDAAPVPLRADRQLDATARGADPATFWFFVAIEVALTAIVLACLVALLRRTLRALRARGAPRPTTPN